MAALLSIGMPAQHRSVTPDVLLALDNSASMQSNDPQRLMAESVHSFARALPGDARLGIVVFDAKPMLAMKLTPTGSPDFGAELQRGLSKINYGGKLTDIPAAMERSIYELRQNGRAEAARSVVLFTDGIIDTGNRTRDEQRTAWLRTEVAQEAHDLSIRIIGIAFTEKADFELMQALAQSTGGQRFRLLQAADIAATFARVATIVASPSPAPGAVRTEPPPSQPPQPEPKPTPAGSFFRKSVLTAAVAVLVLLAGAAWIFRSWREKLPVLAHLTDMTDPNMVYTLKKKLTYIGRDENCGIVVPKPSVGRRHALIRFDEAGFWLRDLRSSNGTWLNGVRVEGSSGTGEDRLHNGDVLKLHKFSFQFSTELIETELDVRKTLVVSMFCANHPSTPTTEYCDECKKMFCRECVQPDGDRHLCVTCRTGAARIPPARV